MRSLNDLAWQKGNTLSRFLVPNRWQLGLTGLAGFAGSVFLKIGCLLFIFTQNEPPLGSPLTCIQSVTGLVCVCEYGCSHGRRYTQTNVSKSSSKPMRKAARRVKSEQTLMQEASHLSHAAQTVFQMPNRTSSSQTHVSADLQQLIFSKASGSMKNKWPLNNTSHYSTYSVLLNSLETDFFISLYWWQSKALTQSSPINCSICTATWRTCNLFLLNIICTA